MSRRRYYTTDAPSPRARHRRHTPDDVPRTPHHLFIDDAFQWNTRLKHRANKRPQKNADGQTLASALLRGVTLNTQKIVEYDAFYVIIANRDQVFRSFMDLGPHSKIPVVWYDRVNISFRSWIHSTKISGEVDMRFWQSRPTSMFLVEVLLMVLLFKRQPVKSLIQKLTDYFENASTNRKWRCWQS